MDEELFVGSVCTPCYTRPQPTASQPAQEPIAKVCHDLEGHIGWNPTAQVNEFLEGMELFAAARPSKAKLLTDQQLRDMCAKFGWDDSYQSIRAYRTVEAMSLELNQLEK
jgi:hypothetical protein